MLLLHQQRKVLQKIFAQVVDLLEKLGFLVEKKNFFPIPCQRLIFLGAVLDSTLSIPQPKLTTIVDTFHRLLAQGSNSVRTLSTLIGQMKCIINRDLGCTTSLQKSSTPTPASVVTSWAGKEIDIPLNLPGTERPRVVGLREQLPSERLSNSAPTYRSHKLEQCLKTGLGRSLTGKFAWGPV